MSNTLLFFFSALGAFNGTLLSLYFFFLARPRHRSNYFLGALLLALSIRVWKSVFYFFNPLLSKIYLQIGLSACFLIGPLLFLYIISSLTKEAGNFWIILIVHLVIILGVGYMHPYSDFPELWNGPFYRAIYYDWLLFILASALLLKDTWQKLINKTSLSYREVWAINVFIGITMVWAGYYAAAYTSYIVGALSFSFVFYLSTLVIYFQKSRRFTTTPKKEKYVNKPIDEKEIMHILSRLDNLLKQNEYFKDPNLTLPQVAKEINISVHKLSQILNQNLDKSFTQFINEYRIEEAKRILETGYHLKMEVLAENCGFNSKSTFYTAFKKITNTTPAKYAEK